MRVNAWSGGRDALHDRVEPLGSAERGDHQGLHELEEGDTDEEGDEPWQPAAQDAAGHARDRAHRRTATEVEESWDRCRWQES